MRANRSWLPWGTIAYGLTTIACGAAFAACVFYGASR